MPEKIEVIEVAIRFADGRIPVIAGTGVNSTSEAIELSRAAVGSGAYATLSVVPYYNKPPQEGIYRHFAAIAEAADIPMIVYNVPGRTVVNMNNDTVLRLAEIPNIIGIKEASGDIGRMVDLVNRVPKDFAIYSGDDPTGMAAMLCGAHGVITVAGNVAPKLFADMCRAALAGGGPFAECETGAAISRNVLRAQPGRAEMGAGKTGLVRPCRAPADGQPERNRPGTSERCIAKTTTDLIGFNYKFQP